MECLRFLGNIGVADVSKLANAPLGSKIPLTIFYNCSALPPILAATIGPTAGITEKR